VVWAWPAHQVRVVAAVPDHPWYRRLGCVGCGVLPGQAGVPAARRRVCPAVGPPYARDCGAPALEGASFEAAGPRIDSTFAYVGTTGMFEAAGFWRIVRIGARSAGLPALSWGLTCAADRP
jgi:hypothetical protein